LGGGCIATIWRACTPSTQPQRGTAAASAVHVSTVVQVVTTRLRNDGRDVVLYTRCYMGSGAAAAGGRPCVERANCRPTLIKRISASTWHQVSLSLAYSQRTRAARRSSRHSPVNQSQHTRATSCGIRHARKTRGFFQEFFSRGRGVSVSETYTQIYIAPKIVRTNPRAPLPILFEVCPLIQPEGLRECCKLPQRGPAENAFPAQKLICGQ